MPSALMDPWETRPGPAVGGPGQTPGPGPRLQLLPPSSWPLFPTLLQGAPPRPNGGPMKLCHHTPVLRVWQTWLAPQTGAAGPCGKDEGTDPEGPAWEGPGHLSKWEVELHPGLRGGSRGTTTPL